MSPYICMYCQRAVGDEHLHGPRPDPYGAEPGEILIEGDIMTTNGKETIALLCSGGIDSTALIGYILANGDMPFLINIDYGAADNYAEWRAIDRIASHYMARGKTIRYINLVIPNAIMFAEQVSKAIPTDSFEEMGEDNRTIFSGRNALLISIAAAAALARNIKTLYVGIAQHDAEANFPDCSGDFLYGMKQAMYSGYDLTLIAPYYHHVRSEIIQMCYLSKVPLHLSYSCYRGGVWHCGKCATCYSRQQSFIDAGFIDPTKYVASPPVTYTAELEDWNVQNW